MAIAFVQKTPNATLPNRVDATIAETSAFGSAVQVGNMIIACCTQYRSAGAEVVTFTDQGSHTWYKAVEILSGGFGVSIGFCYVATSSAIYVRATTANISYKDLGASEYSGIAPGLTAASAYNSANATNATISSNQATISGNNLYIAVAVFRDAVTCAENLGTLLHEEESWDYSNHNSIYYLGSGNQTATWTLGSSKENAGAIAAFAEAGGGASIVPQAYYYMN
jgi:hypothetical protein